MNPTPRGGRQTLGYGLARNFLGQSPRWHKQLMSLFLITKPLLLWLSGPLVGLMTVRSVIQVIHARRGGTKPIIASVASLSSQCRSHTPSP